MPLPRSLFDRSEPQDHDLRVVAGAVPEGLQGELLISAPHPSTLDGPHPFFGEGMVHRLSLRPGTHGAPADRHAWRQATIDSPSARLRSLRPDAFTATMIGVRSPFGTVNSANTAVLPWGDRLFATWDAGRPVEIDPVTFAYLGEVGERDRWSSLGVGPEPVLPMVMSSAHPVIDHDRDVLWTVNTHWGELFVVCWDGEGEVRRWPIDGAVIPQSVHTISQTREWLVIADCAYKVEPQVLAGGARTEPANASAPVYLVRKDELLAAAPGTPVGCRRFELAPETNHYYATYDDAHGIGILFEHTEAAELSMTQQPGDVDALGRPCDPALAGLYGFPMAPDRTTYLVVDPDRGEIVHRAEQREPEWLWTRQLNAIDWSEAGRTSPTVHHTVHQGYRPEAITQEMLALYGDRIDRTLLPPDETPPYVVTSSMPDLEITARWELGQDDVPTSPIFVPRDPGAGPSGSRWVGSDPGGHDGWLVVPVANDDGFRVEVLDAADVSAGPVATLAAPGMRLSFVLHAAWAPDVRPTAAGEAAERRAGFGQELQALDAAGRLDELPDDLRAAAFQVADDLREGAPIRRA
jgi:carotenoid cleavage dioxygenase-like enzyme